MRTAVRMGHMAPRELGGRKCHFRKERSEDASCREVGW